MAKFLNAGQRLRATLWRWSEQAPPPLTGEWKRLQDDLVLVALRYACFIAFVAVVLVALRPLAGLPGLLSTAILAAVVLVSARVLRVVAARTVRRHRALLARRSRRTNRIRSDVRRLPPTVQGFYCGDCRQLSPGRHLASCRRIPVGWFNSREEHGKRGTH